MKYLVRIRKCGQALGSISEKSLQIYFTCFGDKTQKSNPCVRQHLKTLSTVLGYLGC